jgi:hypothetical protein
LVGVEFVLGVEVLLGRGVEFSFTVAIRVGDALAVAARVGDLIGVLVGMRKIGSDSTPASRSWDTLPCKTISVGAEEAIPLAIVGVARDIMYAKSSRKMSILFIVYY